MNFKWLALLVLATGCGAASAQDQTGSVPAYLTEKPSCVLIVGGMGSIFENPKITAAWHEANKLITESLTDYLSQNGYRATSFVMPPGTPGEDLRTSVGALLAHHGCNTFIQISHDIGEDKNGRYFQYSVQMMHVELNPSKPAASGYNTTIVGDYSRDYRYPRTQQAMESFRTGIFADTALEDLMKSDALARVARAK